MVGIKWHIDMIAYTDNTNLPRYILKSLLIFQQTIQFIGFLNVTFFFCTFRICVHFRYICQPLRYKKSKL